MAENESLMSRSRRFARKLLRHRCERQLAETGRRRGTLGRTPRRELPVHEEDPDGSLLRGVPAVEPLRRLSERLVQRTPACVYDGEAPLESAATAAATN